MKKKDLKVFRSAIRSLEREIEIQLKGDTGCCGVSTAQCHIILELNETGPMSVKEISSLFGLDKSTISRTVEGMCACGLIERSEALDDRRRVDIALTEKGTEVALRINAACDSYYEKIFSHIDLKKHQDVVISLSLVADAMSRERKASGGCACASLDISGLKNKKKE